MKIAEAYVELAMKTDSAKKALDEVAAKGEQTAKQVQGEVTKTMQHTQLKGNETAQKLKEWFAAGAFVAGIAKSTKAASDLNEAVNVTGLVFKESRQEIEAFVKDSAKLVGMSETAARSTTANFAGLLKNFGFAESKAADLSIQLTKLAADMGSAFNKDPADAALALGSALRGEQEPIRQFNVNLNEAALKTEALRLRLDASGDTLKANVRAQAALSLIMQQTKDVQGDFANTAGEAANATRISKAEAENAAASLGQSFLPIYREAVKVVGFLAEGFGKLPQPAQLAVVALVGIVALSGPIKDMIGMVKALQAAITGMTLNPTTLGFAALAAVAGVVVTALTLHAQKAKEVAAEARSLTDATLQVTSSMKEQIGATDAATGSLEEYRKKLEQANLEAAQKKLTDKNQVDDLGRLGVTFKDLIGLYGDLSEREKTLEMLRRKAIETGEVQMKHLQDYSLTQEQVNAVTEEWIRTGTVSTETLQDLGVNVMDVVGGNEDLIRSFSDMALSAGKSNQQLLDLAVAGDRMAELWATQTGNLEKLTPAQQEKIKADMAAWEAEKKLSEAAAASATTIEKKTKAVEEWVKKIKPAKTAEEEAADAAKDLKNAIDSIFSGALDFDQALSNYNEKLGELGKNLRENGKTIAVDTEKGRANRQVIRDTTQAALDYAQALKAQGATNDEVRGTIDNYVTQLRGQLQQLGLNKQQIEEYIAQLNLTPEDITTSLQVADDATAKRQVQELLEQYDKIPDDLKTTIQTLIDQGQYAKAKAMVEWFTTGDHVIRFNMQVASGAQIELKQKGAQAEGGRSQAGMPYVVGERGRELFIPDTDGTVMSTEALRGMVAGSGSGTIDASVHVYGNVYGVEDLDGWAAERERKLALAIGAQGRR